MENNSAKKLSRAAAILSLTAVLASMPVSADGYAIATSTYACARANGMSPNAYAELSCEWGGENKHRTEPNINTVVEVSVYSSEVEGDGMILASQAEAWADGHQVGFDYWYIGANN